MKVNWIKSIAYGIGVAGLSAIPQFGFAQSGQYVAPSAWNNFNSNATTQSPRQGSAQGHPAQGDPASPHFRTVGSGPQGSLGGPSPAEHANGQPTYNYAPQQSHYSPAQGSFSAPPSLTAPQTSYPAPSHSVARRNDSSAMVEGQLNGHIEQLAPGPASHSGPLVSEQFQGNSPAPAQSPFLEAAAAPWDSGHYGSESCGSGMAGGFVGGDCGPVRPPLFPWFGGADLLFWTMANNTNHRMVLETGMPSTTLLSTRQVDPGDGIGYDLFFGRYFGCGQYAVSVNYLNFDPGRERAMVAGAPLAYYAAMPAFESIGYYNDPLNPNDFTSMKDVFDGMPNFAIDRNVSFQGVELNLWSFGFGGARRLAPACGTGLACGFYNPLGDAGNAGCGPHGACGPRHPPKHGYGGFGGPLERPCVGSSQLALSQGFRWFQFNDDFRFSAFDGANRAMFDSNAQNDLFGYQIGGRWNYCLTSRINLGMGAKFGAYANRVDVRQRAGDNTGTAVYKSDTLASRRPVNMRDRGTVLAGLGEIDLGAGVRLTDAWTIRGGYRVLGVSGVATSVGMLKHEMFSENVNARHEANDSVLLHGAYIGGQFNW